MLALRRMSKAFGGVSKLAVERQHVLPNAFAEGQSGTEEPKSSPTDDGNPAYSPAAADAWRD